MKEILLNKKTLFLVLLAVSILFNASISLAVPISYYFSGSVVDSAQYMDSSDVGIYDHPAITASNSVDGYITWDTELAPDYSNTHVADPIYYLPMNGISFMSLNIGGVTIEFDYSYYYAHIRDSDVNDVFHLYNIGTRPFEYMEQRYEINIADFFFYSNSNLFPDTSYPEGIDLSVFDFLRINTSIDSFLDLRDGTMHNYLNPFEINIDQIETISVPEPSLAAIFMAGLICCLVIKGLSIGGKITES